MLPRGLNNDHQIVGIKMDVLKWTARIRKELNCDVIDYYALQSSFEITATRLVADERYELVVIHSYQKLEIHSDTLLERSIVEFKAKHPHFFS